uniref:Uncharacterized protein n=1 Tax=viral metagenome TaxID=1070528 RepID=A0A6M3KBJ2_9ZZZZ
MNLESDEIPNCAGVPGHDGPCFECPFTCDCMEANDNYNKEFEKDNYDLQYDDIDGWE